jgi:predicted HD phosphohydrolase
MAAVDEVEAVLRSLRGLWDEDAVDELDHALQAAARAINDGADDELVLATALHDVGHSPLFGDVAASQHDRVAREWLTPRFGERVGWLAGAHVAAKRYLAATDSGYARASIDDALAVAERVLRQGDSP